MKRHDQEWLDMQLIVVSVGLDVWGGRLGQVYDSTQLSVVSVKIDILEGRLGQVYDNTQLSLVSVGIDISEKDDSGRYTTTGK